MYPEDRGMVVPVPNTVLNENLVGNGLQESKDQNRPKGNHHDMREEGYVGKHVKKRSEEVESI